MESENKQAICDELCKTLQITRAGGDLRMLVYSTGEDGEFVTAVFDKVSRTVNVTADSGTAMIRDIMKIF